ncbi:deoxyribose-phosphate aldolase [Mycobacteroides sp. CBMA 271]|uniref:deoxyribose-phosphate aldolase n=2 Tax=unclassified Mycobacteroides TaxID=2618759 RepID=UPI001FB69D0F|nr:deoxyribose-phosphate aldolase [Mycobacteroides sp. CBMA 271]
MAHYVDHTLLKSEATAADIAAHVLEALELGTYSICVSPNMLPLALPENSDLKIAVVCGFPSGKHDSSVKAAEAALAVVRGAHEIDMVIDIGAAIAGEIKTVESDIAAVRLAAPSPIVLKVIIESAVLSDDQIRETCLAAERAGADFVKTSTGFHPWGGASLHAVRLMARTVGGRLGVKASGGIRTGADAIAMVDAGATRLGLSSSRAVLEGATAELGVASTDSGY